MSRCYYAQYLIISDRIFCFILCFSVLVYVYNSLFLVFPFSDWKPTRASIKNYYCTIEPRATVADCTWNQSFLISASPCLRGQSAGKRVWVSHINVRIILHGPWFVVGYKVTHRHWQTAWTNLQVDCYNFLFIKAWL